MVDISVLIPCYNCSLMLPRAVASVLSQGVDYQIVLIDDCSTDGITRQLIEEYADEHDCVTPVFRKTNGRIAAALNSGAEVATGKYIIRLDSDDWFEVGALERLRAALDANPVGFVYGGRKYYGRRSDVYMPKPYSKQAFYLHNASGYAYMFRRGYLDNGLRWEALGEFGGAIIDLEDWQFVLKLIAAGADGLALTDTLVLHYTFRWGGTWQELQNNKGAALTVLKTRYPEVMAVDL